MAVQIAKARGAYVVATASTRKVEFVRELGADEVVDYTKTSLETIAKVDAVIDPFGGDRTLGALALVRDGGTLTMLLPPVSAEVATAAAERGIRIAEIGVRPNPVALTALTELVERGELWPHVQAAYPLEKAADAHAELDLGVQGKLVLVP
jgi:NADPH:quinone reductase-like Zn-dependent oxidoreductase